MVWWFRAQGLPIPVEILTDKTHNKGGKKNYSTLER